MSSLSFWRGTWVLMALAAIGCGGSGEGDPGPSPTIQVTVAPPSLQVTQGGSGTVTVTLSRGGGFSGTATVSISGAPAGVTTDINPSTLTGTTTTATVTVNVAPSTPAGTYPITVRASATGVGEATAQYTLEVLALPNYTLTASPNAVTIPQGLTGTATVNIARTNFTGGVTLSLDNPPSGITGSFNPSPATGGSSLLTLSVPLSTPVGTYNVTVKGSATGPGDKTTTIAVTVTQAPSYTLSLNPNALTINAGANQTATVNIVRTNYTGAVTLALDSPPAGVTATFAPPAPTDNQSTMTLNVANTVAPGNYTITVKGTASGVPTVVNGEVQTVAPGDRTTTLQLTVMPAPNYTLTANSNSVNSSQGGTANSTITINRTNFTGSVALTLESTQAGITGTFNPASTTGTTSALTINVAANVPVGVYSTTVKGTATGLSDKTTTIAVTVVSGPSVSLSVNPASLSIQQGANAQTTLTVARTNFTGHVVPSVSGAPGGMTVTFNPNPITGNSSVVTVAVGGGVGVGTYNLTITGSTSSAGNPTTQLQVTVTAPPPGNMQVQFCGTEDWPVWFGKKDGNGAWQEVIPTDNGTTRTYTFNVTSAVGGIAFTQQSSSSITSGMQTALARRGIANADDLARRAVTPVNRAFSSGTAAMRRTISYVTQEYRFLSSESGPLLASFCFNDPPLGQATLTAQNLAGSEQMSVAMSGSITQLTAGQSTKNEQLPTGTTDVWATRGPLSTFVPTHSDRQNNKTVPGSVTINASTMVPLATANHTYTGAAGGTQFSSFMMLDTPNGNVGTMFGGFPSSSNVVTAFAHPTSFTGDMYSLWASGFVTSGMTTTGWTDTRYLGPTVGSAQTRAAPPTMPTPTETTVGTGRYSISGARPATYQDISITRSSTNGNGYTILASNGWLANQGMAANYTIAMDDLSGANFPAAAALGPLQMTSVAMLSTNITSSATSLRNASSSPLIPSIGSYIIWTLLIFQYILGGEG